MSKQEQLEQIHNSLVNGQLRQMCEQINEYGNYDFWEDYRDYLKDTEQGMAYHLFSKAAIAYFKIKYR